MDYLRVRVDGLELKGFDGEGAGEFTGHAAVFGNRDYGGDIIEPGAFTKTLKERKGKAVLLDSHDSRSRVGIVYLDEDSKGLRVVKGVLNLNKQIARDVYEDMKFQSAHDLPLEMSIGYETVKRDIRGDTRHLKEINLIEVSVVTLGMNPKAKVSRVKEADEVEILKTRIETLENELAALRSGTKSSEAAANTIPEPVKPDHSEEVDVPESYRSALAELTAFTRSRSNNG